MGVIRSKWLFLREGMPQRLSVMWGLLSAFFLGLLLLSSLAQAEMSAMQKAKYATPMPNLMMLIESHSLELELDNDQLNVVRDWRKAHHHQTQQWVSELIETEKFMHDAALEGASDEDMADYRDDVLQKRADLIGLKTRCVKRMRQTFDKEQWSRLMTLYQNRQQAMMRGAKKVNEVQSFLRVSPMPKLMVIVLMQSDKLELSPEQANALEKWRIDHMNRWSAMFDKVVRSEKKLTQEALAMAPAETLEAQFSELLQIRKEMASMSLACRDNLRKVLSDSQWQTLVTLFEGEMAG